MEKEYVFTVRVRAYEDEFTDIDKEKAIANAILEGENGSLVGKLSDAHVKLVCVNNVDPQEEG